MLRDTALYKFNADNDIDIIHSFILFFKKSWQTQLMKNIVSNEVKQIRHVWYCNVCIYACFMWRFGVRKIVNHSADNKVFSVLRSVYLFSSVSIKQSVITLTRQQNKADLNTCNANDVARP